MVKLLDIDYVIESYCCTAPMHVKQYYFVSIFKKENVSSVKKRHYCAAVILRRASSKVDH